MLVEKLFPSGGWEVSDIVDDEYYRMRYFDYTKKEAIAEFKAYVKEAGRA